ALVYWMLPPWAWAVPVATTGTMAAARAAAATFVPNRFTERIFRRLTFSLFTDGPGHALTENANPIPSSHTSPIEHTCTTGVSHTCELHPQGTAPRIPHPGEPVGTAEPAAAAHVNNIDGTSVPVTDMRKFISRT